MATRLTGFATVSGQDVASTSSTQQMPIGSYMETADGRGYRYALVGATATVPGKVYAAAVWTTSSLMPVGGLGLAAAALGATQVTLTDSLTIAANQLAGGYLFINITPDQGYTYLVASNTAVSGATGCVVTLADPIVGAALTTASKATIVKHPYDSIIVSPGGASTGQPVGVATTVITAAQYGWIQTYGACAVLAGVATSISLPGVPVTPSASTAGSVIVSTAILPTIGWAMQLMTATEYDGVFLTIH